MNILILIFRRANRIKNINLIFKFLLSLIIIVTFLLFCEQYNSFILFNKFKNKTEINIFEPFLPLNEEEILIKKYNKSKYQFSNLRYHFDDLYRNRTIFKINYSYLPYTKYNKSKEYDENAKFIFESTGILNITLLDYYKDGKLTERSSFNHIHISIGSDKNFALLSLLTITSLLNNTNPETFIHLHILLLNCDFEDIKHFYELKYINENVEFIFYNAKQAEFDFSRGKAERRGIGEYTRILAPEIVNNTNRLIILDTGDLIVNKDLSELYYYDIEDNYFVCVLDDNAGNINNHFLIFSRNRFYPNGGVCLINVRKFRKDKLYKEAYYTSIAYKNLPCPFQDILLVISHYKIKYFPLNYNCQQYFNDDRQLKEKRTDTKWFQKYLQNQQFSPFKYSKDEIIEAATDPVIYHLYQTKPHLNSANSKLMDKFREYAKLTGVIEDIKKKYPKFFS